MTSRSTDDAARRARTMRVTRRTLLRWTGMAAGAAAAGFNVGGARAAQSSEVTAAFPDLLQPGASDSIKAVFAQLAEQMPGGLRYVAIRLDDGVSFMHVAVLEGDDNPLAALPAFGEFVSAISERCTHGPAPVNGTVVGAYGIEG